MRRFARVLGGAFPFGDGAYSGNIVQGGSVLQPVALYAAADGKTYRDCLVVTGAATVAPDADTGAAVFFCRSLVLDGASASLSASTNCKGLLGFAQEGIALLNGAKLHMNALGRAGGFGDLAPSALIPVRWRGRVAPGRLAAWPVKGEGAAGGAANARHYTDAAPGAGPAASAMQTGGGGGGGGGDNVSGYPGAGGAGGGGGPCCGGAGGGGSGGPQGTCGYTGYPGGGYGGPGGNAQACTGSWTSGGGAGDPVGAGGNGGGPGQGAGGGLLMLFAPGIAIGAGCIVSADGAAGGNGTGCCGGGGAGGGCVVLAAKSGGYANSGTVRAAGGPGGTGWSAAFNGSAGGAGSVNITEAT
jgi:hypothetical protein